MTVLPFPVRAVARVEQERIEHELGHEHQQHQARFKEQRMWAGYCRWMALRFRPRPDKADTPDR